MAVLAAVQVPFYQHDTKQVVRMSTKGKLTFEQSMARLEEIVGLLERGDAPLEQAMTLFEEGAAILRTCTAQLDAAEQKVKLLTANSDGQPQEQTFQISEEGT